MYRAAYIIADLVSLILISGKCHEIGQIQRISDNLIAREREMSDSKGRGLGEGGGGGGGGDL